MLDVAIPYMRCPSTNMPLKPYAQYETHASYAGISGAASEGANDPFQEPEQEYHSGNLGQIFSAAGMLPPNSWIGLGQCMDGSSNVMVIGEMSGTMWDLNDAPVERSPSGSSHGWLMGTRLAGVPPNIDPDGDADMRTFNIHTMRHPINARPWAYQVYPGEGSSLGANNPLTSNHPGGVLVLLADSSVQFPLGEHSTGHAQTLGIAQGWRARRVRLITSKEGLTWCRNRGISSDSNGSGSWWQRSCWWRLAAVLAVQTTGRPARSGALCDTRGSR